MSTDLTRREQIVSSLTDKQYRDAFVADQIRIGVPLQIKDMRTDREWSQEVLGQHMEPSMAQESVWRLENPNKANLTIGTLLRVASALDVALIVRFVPFSELIDSTPWLSGRNGAVAEYSKDAALCVAPTIAQTTAAVTSPTGSTTSTLFGLQTVALAGLHRAAVAIAQSYSELGPIQRVETTAGNTRLAKAA